MTTANRATQRRSGQRFPRTAAGVAMAISLVCLRLVHALATESVQLDGPPGARRARPAASLDQIMAAVNANAAKIQSYQTNNASINVPGSLGIPTLAQHRRDAARADSAGSVDGRDRARGRPGLERRAVLVLGAAQRAAGGVFRAALPKRAGSAAQQLMPIEPQWLLDALGHGGVPPPRPPRGAAADATRTRSRSRRSSSRANGPLIKRTVVDAPKAWCLEQHLYDGAGTLLASAVAKSHRYYPKTGVSLPQVVEIRIPPAELAMTIDVGTVELNRLADNPAVWSLPAIPGSPPWTWARRRRACPAAARRRWGARSRANWYDPAPAVGALPIAGTIAAGPRAGRLDAVAAGTCRHRMRPPLPRRPQFVPPGGVAQPATVESSTAARHRPRNACLPAACTTQTLTLLRDQRHASLAVDQMPTPARCASSWAAAGDPSSPGCSRSRAWRGPGRRGPVPR